MKVSAVAIIAALASAEDTESKYSTNPYEQTTAEQSKYDDMCIHCIDDYNLFCSNDQGKTGKCMPATCEEGVLTGEDFEAAHGECTLKPHSCNDRDGGFTAMIHYSECK